MIRSFRARLIVTVIALIALTAAALSVTAYLLVRRSLRAQVVDAALARAEFNVGVLADRAVLPPGAGRAELEASGLVERFLLRGTDGVYVEFPAGGEAFASSLALFDTPDLVEPDLRALVAAGELGYEFLDVAGEPSVVVAARRPPDGPDFYFFSTAADVGDALGQLRRALIGGGLALVAAGALAAGGIARRVLRPVREASAAAEAMASGDLGVRLPAAASADEFGRWAESFNRMAASLEEKIAALQAAQQREQRFTADVSHELRTPLTALVNEAAMVRDHLDAMPGGDRRLGELLVADTTRLRRLVEDLLEISRLDAGAPVPVADTPVDLARFVAAVAAERHPDADVQVDPVQVLVDRTSLERILGNLLDNARAHAPGARTTVTAGVTAGSPAGSSSRRLTLVVADDGPGAPGADLELLFDRFAKADAARGGGSGLGLAIARQHARRLGGELTARHRRGGGMEFELTVPVTQPLPAGDPAATAPAHPGVDRKER